MGDRDADIDAFLAAHGWAGARRKPLAGDASFRRYQGLVDGGRRAVLMDAPPAHEDVGPFIKVARHLYAQGYSAPGILAEDAAAGLLLLEDLGDDLYTRIIPDGADEKSLYAAAVDLLIDLHRRDARLELPPYDDAAFLEEADLLVDWFLPALEGRPTPEAARRAYEAAWYEVLPLARRVPDRIVLRDYHADNLLWLPRRQGVRRVGLLDFQDALIGPLAYDLVSLLEDARRDVAAATTSAMIARYLAALPELDPDTFHTAYAVLGAQRNCKIIGIFTRLYERDHKPVYLDYLPRVWGHLARDLAHPAVEPVRRWLDATIPPGLRGRPR
ncbi:MAG: aminoglycoside phosphotransferase family protein [Alphaproteobacteria bacterium]